MDRHSLVYISEYDINIGDKVIVSKDLDVIQKPKSSSSHIYFLKEVLSNNWIKIKNKTKTEVVKLSSVKKSKKMINVFRKICL